MQILLVDRGHWHAPLHLQAFAASGQPVSFPPESAEDPLEAALAQSPELLILLGPPGDMLRDLRRCLEAGIPVVLEKPVGRAAGELAPLAELAQRWGAFVSVAQPHLQNRFWAVCTGEAGGPLSHLRFRLVNGSPRRYRQMGVPWVLDEQRAGGGVLRNLGIHGISAFLKATSGRVQVHSCVLSRRLYWTEAEEYASVVLSAGGVIGHVEVGYTAALDSASEFELTGHRRDLTVRDDGQHLNVLDRCAGQVRSEPVLPLARRYEQFAAATLQALKADQPPPHPLADHLQAMQVIDECYAVATWVNT
ncbi:Gfo/Idh/MocA family oxidoreductase (plasmid) [Deinococcus metallilatus]|uniref:Dehydrogenase n=1 Tax=Deinococcus metallilatus TaxID=1211322 RepID=A0ABR6MYD3_9DEIO|nr:Gfo/Idh/MocA family oxidoreductase [Deinococcus metallilatus]MBB5296962.1 putative dehydrogenase [Deinococcus metallilatus]QBY06670.1 Gfo/Idh/MocA family oxidoreductase [Deinococcus metallilatus]GMA15139.1 hypothetical protein GCM10025871_14700 [Deinococcus metallilatus]